MQKRIYISWNSFNKILNREKTVLQEKFDRTMNFA